MAKKTLKESELDELLKSERPDGLVILAPEDVESVVNTIKHLRGEVDKLKGKEKK